MKRIISLLMILILFASSLSSCSQKQINYTVDMASIYTNVGVIEERYEAIYDMICKKRSTFTDSEWNELQTIDTDARLLDKKYRQIFSKTGYQITLSEIMYMYELSKDSYVRARAIVMSHKNSFDSYENLQFTIFDDNAKDLDKMILNMIENPDNNSINESLVSILTVAGTALKIVLPMLLV